MQRALEIEQARVEAMQAALLEKQRLRREVRYYAALGSERERAALERRRIEEARLQSRAGASRGGGAGAAGGGQGGGGERQARRGCARAEEGRQAQAEDAARSEAEQARQRAEEEAAGAQRRRKPAAPRIERSDLPGVDTDPLASDADDDAPQPRRRNPFSLDNLLESLEQ